MGGSEAFHDEIEDELHEIEMREEKLRNFDAFGETEVTSFQKFTRACGLLAIPLCFSVLFCGGIIAAIVLLTGVAKGTGLLYEKPPPTAA